MLTLFSKPVDPTVEAIFNVAVDEVIQPLMDQVYAKWQEHTSPRFRTPGQVAEHYNFSDAHKAAVAIGKLSQQVLNGGFEQWHYNGYHQDLEMLEWALAKIATPTARDALGLLNTFMEYQEKREAVESEIDEELESTVWLREYVDRDQVLEQVTEGLTIEYRVEELDEQFWALDEQLMIDLANWILSNKDI